MKSSLLTAFVTLLAAPLLTATAADGQEPGYAWPTDASRLLTSTFGEYRSHRFHAGFDVKTFGQVGYKALAVRPGSVVRAEVSPWGYGRVIYLLLDTGETAVYGHLQKFSAAIASRVTAEQERRGSYSVEMRFAAGELPVTQGEVIGWTGQSGSGAPHLHFELRDPDGAPINPLLKGYEIIDTTAPEVRRVLLLPLDAHSRVAGDLNPVVFIPKTVAPGRLRIDKPIPVLGRIAMAVNLHDQMDGAYNRMNVYRYRLLIDGREIFSARYDRFPYELNHHADLDRDYRSFVRGRDLYQRLFREAGNQLPFYASSEPWYGVLECDPAAGAGDWLSRISRALGVYWDLPDGVTVLENGRHPFRIEVFDFNDNSTVVEGELLAAPVTRLPLEDPAAAPLERARYTITADYFDSYARVLVRANLPVRQVPGLIACYADGYEEEILLERAGKAEFRGGVPLHSSHTGPVRLLLLDPAVGAGQPLHEATLACITVRPGKLREIVTQDGLCQITFGREALFKPLFVRAQTQNGGGANGVVGPVYAIEPEDVPLKGSVSVAIRVPAGVEEMTQVALYRRSGSGWSYIGGDPRPDGSIGGASRELGEFALVRDAEPPALAFVKPAAGQRLSLRTPLIKASLHDALSGIGSETQWQMRLDGQLVIAEYDPEARALLHQVSAPLGKGRHTAEVTARDRCGNQAQRTLTFWIN